MMLNFPSGVRLSPRRCLSPGFFPSAMRKLFATESPIITSSLNSLFLTTSSCALAGDCDIAGKAEIVRLSIVARIRDIEDKPLKWFCCGVPGNCPRLKSWGSKERTSPNRFNGFLNKRKVRTGGRKNKDAPRLLSLVPAPTHQLFAEGQRTAILLLLPLSPSVFGLPEDHHSSHYMRANRLCDSEVHIPPFPARSWCSPDGSWMPLRHDPSYDRSFPTRSGLFLHPQSIRNPPIHDRHPHQARKCARGEVF